MASGSRLALDSRAMNYELDQERGIRDLTLALKQWGLRARDLGH